MQIKPYNPRDWRSHPPYSFAAYGSSVKRGPLKTRADHANIVGSYRAALWRYQLASARTIHAQCRYRQRGMGERIIVVGRVLDEDEKPVPNTLIEIWQANAAGRYHHPVDQHNAPSMLTFPAGRCLTNDKGEYRYLRLPGAYPWLNHTNAWRPAHIHLSLFGPSFVHAPATQFFFPGDPLIALDPILNRCRRKAGRQRLMSSYAHDVTEPEFALGYRFDIVLRGRKSTPFEGRQ
jgi:protocatechuate 3,4-dioxygenase beta subunit